MHRASPSVKERTSIAALAALGLFGAACGQLVSRQPTLSTPSVGIPSAASSPALLTNTLPPTGRPTVPPATSAPLPTIEPGALDSFLLTLINDDACRLPCWWNISVGTTTWQEAQQLFQRVGSTIQPGTANRPGRETFYVQFPLPGSIAPSGARFSVMEGIVDSVFIGSNATASRFRLNQVLVEYGAPDSILVRTFTSAPEPYLPFTLVLVYQQRRFLATYEFEAQVSGTNVVGCPERVSPTIHIRSSSDPWSEEEIQTEVLGQEPSTLLRPIGQVTALDVPTFVTLFHQEDSGACIQTPASDWQ